MRILYVVNDLDRYRPEQQLLLAAGHLPRDQFDVHVAVLSEVGELGAELKSAGVSPKSIERRWRLDPLAALRLKRLVGRLQPDVIHTGDSDAAVYGRWAAAGASRARVVSSVDLTDRRSTCQCQPLGRLLAANVATTVVLRESDRDALVRRRLPAEKIVVIPPGFAPAPAGDLSRGQLTAELGLPESVYLIGIVGQLEADQQWKEVIWTLDILRCLRDDVHVVVVGDGRIRWQLERFARLCTLDSHVYFLGRRADVRQLLPHFNHLWQGPGSRALAIGAAEALAAGVPVVASDTASNRELVIHDQTGFFVPIGGRVERARYANRLLNDPALRARLGEGGRCRASERFGMESMLAGYVEMYRRVAGH